MRIPRNNFKWLLVFFYFVAISCSSPSSKLFSKRTPHETYANKIKEAGLAHTALAMRWNEAATLAWQQAVTIALPYQETGYFAAEKPSAAAYLFRAKKGHEIRIRILVKAVPGMLWFADVFERRENNELRFVVSATDSLDFRFEAGHDGNYLLRIQPELLQNGSYHVTIADGPSLGFPVDAGAKARIGSFFGNSRDGGNRKHEGIDIFGKFRSPVVAVANGYITNVSENNLGGKVVFMRPSKKDYSVYYAHLDTQVVREGQTVETGDTIGLMGNTGNAKTTPAHLHFGIYTANGAIDPLPFVSQNNEMPAAIKGDTSLLNQWGMVTTTTTGYAIPALKGQGIYTLPAETPLLIVGATSIFYKTEMPGGLVAYVPWQQVHIQKGKKSIKIPTDMVLIDHPSDTAVAKSRLLKGSEIIPLGKFNQHVLVSANGITGWQKTTGLNGRPNLP